MHQSSQTTLWVVKEPSVFRRTAKARMPRLIRVFNGHTCSFEGTTVLARLILDNFGHMGTAKAQISLRIRAVRSGLSLSANRITGRYRMYEWRAKARMIIFAHAQDDLNLCVAHVQRHFFDWRGTVFKGRFCSYLDRSTSICSRPSPSTLLTEGTLFRVRKKPILLTN